MRQSGKNFIYASDLLKGVKIDVNVKEMPLGKTLKKMFRNTGIDYKVKGNNIILVRSKKKQSAKVHVNDPRVAEPDSIKVGLLSTSPSHPSSSPADASPICLQ